MKITKHLSIAEIIEICPDAMDILLEYGLHCVGCGAASWESLEDGALSHGMSQDMIDHMLEEINECMTEKESQKNTSTEQIKKEAQKTEEDTIDISEEEIDRLIQEIEEEIEEEKSKEKKLKYCLPIQVSKQSEILEIFQKNKESFDLFEVWLDSIEDLDIQELISACPKEILCVCKAKEEKGSFLGTEKERVDLLIQAAQAGAHYIDIGIHTQSDLIKKCIQEKGKTQLVLSFHNWDKTPKLTSMLTRIDQMLEFKPDYIKYIATAETVEDNIQIFRLAENLKKKSLSFIVMCMGEQGKISRIVTPLLGSAWAYAPKDKAQASAPGQLSIDELQIASSLLY